MTYTKLSIIIKDKPPYFIGSQLRGALGYALKRVTCINPSYSCNGCFASSNCLYHEFYEEKNTLLSNLLGLLTPAILISAIRSVAMLLAIKQKLGSEA